MFDGRVEVDLGVAVGNGSVARDRIRKQKLPEKFGHLEIFFGILKVIQSSAVLDCADKQLSAAGDCLHRRFPRIFSFYLKTHQENLV